MNTESCNYFTEFLNLLFKQDVFFEPSNALGTEECRLLLVKKTDWSKFGSLTKAIDFRWVATWASHVEKEIQINTCLEKKGNYLLLRASITENNPEISSLVSYYPDANRSERHTHDMFGVVFTDHPNFIRWTRHKAWSETEFPLRKDFLNSEDTNITTPADSDYPFTRIEGSSVCEIPVGPVHAGIIEPGHFRFHVAGEDVLSLEEHLGYVHKGIEKLAEGREIDNLICLAGRISGDSTVSHAWAACQACEKAARIEVPERALFIRAIMAERERVANHLGDIGAICNDVGFAFANYQFGRLRELWQRLNADIFGHRLTMDCLIFGGVKKDLADKQIKQISEQIDLFRKEVLELFTIIDNNDSLQDRLKTTGILTPEIAKKIGALGYVGRSSGCTYDLRRDAAYFPYDQVNIEIPVFTKGDVASRVKIRAKEISASFNLIEEFITKLPATKIIATQKTFPKNAEGLGLIEGWRGEILTYVSFDHEGKVSRFFPRDPSWLNWPALEHLIQNNIIPDFPVCNKSINGSYSGHDL